MLDELATTTIVVKAHCIGLSTSTNIFCIPSSLENEELELFDSKIIKLSHVKV
jgi:hypothetical protein